ncbi:hypothetical protein G2W53_008580 [Senna tora]|uniref:Uncharacterized protein n=1 Tax=Senna tora TaxID=362788 RepID=A0A834X782_9FABA|nr:hypothetical protein G2W53_008580 [Senna tora]
MINNPQSHITNMLQTNLPPSKLLRIHQRRVPPEGIMASIGVYLSEHSLRSLFMRRVSFEGETKVDDSKKEEVEVALAIAMASMMRARPFGSAFGLVGSDLREEKQRL